MRINDRNRGIKAMIRDLDQLSDELAPEKVKARLDPLTAELTEELRAVMPVRTGALKSSGHWSSDASETHYLGTIEFGGELAPYAPFVIGAYVSGEHPWDAVFPAYESKVEDALANIWDSSIGR